MKRIRCKPEGVVMLATGKPIEYFKIVGPKSKGRVIGLLDGTPFTEFVVDDFGRTYRYAGVAKRNGRGRFAVDDLRPGEFLVDCGLVYSLNTEPPQRSILASLIWRSLGI
jgi:hypothetical protein